MTVSEVIAAYGALVERAVAVLDAQRRNCPDADDPVRLVVVGEKVVVEWEECRYEDGMETEKETVPLAVLGLGEDAFRAWVEGERRRREEERAAAVRARARLDEAAAEARDRAEWERLRVKFGEKG